MTTSVAVGALLLAQANGGSPDAGTTGQRSEADSLSPVPATSASAVDKRGLQKSVERDAPQYKGADYCSGCHSPSADNKLPRDWVALDEFPTWEKH
ncbi:MAG TPA: hypothetical protein VKB78_15410, partial [Pirellulales bacterium]|nr:hypothetical protein [Pirellulales bacterium]